MGRVFAVRPAAIEKFLWGRSMAPPGHRLADTSWYTIWHTAADRTQTVTLRLDAERRIIERVQWERPAPAAGKLAYED